VAEPERGEEAELEAEWGERARSEPRWPASVAVAVAIGLQVVLPHRLVLGPRWVLPMNVRGLAIALIALINAANLISLGYLVHALVASHPVGGRTLIFASIPVWLTNIIVFALWYWELDRGGPAARGQSDHGAPDFLFPQMDSRGSTDPDWSPTFLDYLYTSFTNVTAFSPTDTMPLSAWAKVLMMVQSLASLLTVGLVISRAVNIL
jgi:hypothetical protein